MLKTIASLIHCTYKSFIGLTPRCHFSKAQATYSNDYYQLFFFFSSSAVIEDGKNYVGCVKNSSLLPPPHEISFKAHEVAPSRCIEECRKKQFQWALIQNKFCKCLNDNSTVYEVNETRCSLRCWSNSSLICGGEETFSAYKTGNITTFLFVANICLPS